MKNRPAAQMFCAAGRDFFTEISLLRRAAPQYKALNTGYYRLSCMVREITSSCCSLVSLLKFTA